MSSELQKLINTAETAISTAIRTQDNRFHDSAKTVRQSHIRILTEQLNQLSGDEYDLCLQVLVQLLYEQEAHLQQNLTDHIFATTKDATVAQDKLKELKDQSHEWIKISKQEPDESDQSDESDESDDDNNHLTPPKIDNADPINELNLLRQKYYKYDLELCLRNVESLAKELADGTRPNMMVTASDIPPVIPHTNTMSQPGTKFQTLAYLERPDQRKPNPILALKTANEKLAYYNQRIRQLSDLLPEKTVTSIQNKTLPATLKILTETRAEKVNALKGDLTRGNTTRTNETISQIAALDEKIVELTQPQATSTYALINNNTGATADSFELEEPASCEENAVTTTTQSQGNMDQAEDEFGAEPPTPYTP